MARAQTHDRVFGVPALWYAVLAGPIGWTLHLLITYGLVEVACNTSLLQFAVAGVPGVVVLVVIATVLTAAPIAYALLVAYRRWRIQREAQDERGYGEEDRAGGFMAVSGIMLSGLFLVATLLEGAPVLVLRPCGWP